MYDMITTPDMMTSVDSLAFSPMPFSNPYGDIDLMDIPAAHQPWLGNPYIEYDYMPLYPDTSAMLFANPYEEGLMNQIDIMTQDVMAPGAMMFGNPFGDPEMAHAMGLISDQDYAFLQMIGPKHHSDPISVCSDPVEVRPIIGPSKEEWAEYDDYESQRSAAVDNYHDCLDRGDLDEAAKWADKAVDCQYHKETLYDGACYVPDVEQRAGLY